MKKIVMPVLMVLAMAVMTGCDNQLSSLLKQAAAATTVLAASSSPMDSDRDGMVSKDEWTSFNAAMFAKFDADSNGELAADELKAMGGPGRAAMRPPVEEMDADKNGAVSADEWNSFHDRVFTEIDENGDGSLSKAERAAHRKTHGPGGGPAFGMMDADGNGSVSQDEWTSFHAVLFGRGDADSNDYLSVTEQTAMAGGPAAPPFARMDSDGDGNISENEWSNFHISVFLEMDKNGDGSLAGSELPASN